MFDLNSVKAIEHLDRHNILGRLKAFPEELLVVCKEAEKIKPLRSWRGISDITICGMGGSGIAGQIAIDWALPTSPINLRLVHDFTLPRYISEHSLVICTSYSGSTREVIACASLALERKAHVFVITSEDSELDRFAETHNLPVFYSTSPPPPRLALAHLLAPIVGLFDRLGITDDFLSQLIDSAELLNELLEKVKETKIIEENPAKLLAREIGARTPVILHSNQFSSLGTRFATMVHENAKAHAFSYAVPEYAHNFIESRDRIHDFMYIIVRSSLDHPPVATATDAVIAHCEKNKIHHTVVDLIGKNIVEQALFGLYTLDFVSFYLAMVRHENPFYTERIDAYKKYFKEHSA